VNLHRPIKLHSLKTENSLQSIPDLPAALQEEVNFIGQIEDFPAMVKIAVDSGANFHQVLFITTETVQVTKLQAIIKQLRQIPVHDHWERKVLLDLQQDFKSLQSDLVKCILQSGGTTENYFKEGPKKNQLQHFLHHQHQIQSQYSLMPYIVL